MPKVYAALPVLDEADNVPIIINNLLEQQDVETELIICVNQPDEWWSNPLKREKCIHNIRSIEYIQSLNDKRVTLIDRASRGNGWIGKKHGVGWARKNAMDKAASFAADDDLIISVDADTWYPENYFADVHRAFLQTPAAGLSAPYYHTLTSDKIADRCILRYEIYMRNYALNMLLIRNPYCFSAIGSGMACTAGMYRKVKGLTPKMSGEDFYFMQKLRKAGPVIINCDSTIYPAARFSDRVYFGTGPAMIKGRSGNWESYPIYSQDLFLEVKATFDRFPLLYESQVDTPMDSFLLTSFVDNCDSGNTTSRIWGPLRKNTTGSEQFIKAAFQKIDALKILQFLKQAERNDHTQAEERLANFLINNFSPGEEIREILNSFISEGFENCSLLNLNLIRDFMFVNERKLQHELIIA